MNTEKKRMKKLLNKSKRKLVKGGFIDSPVFYVKSGNGSFGNKERIHLKWIDETTKKIAISLFREYCHDTNAEEVISVSDNYIHLPSDEGEHKIDALLVQIENQDGIKQVVAPYYKSIDGQIIFEGEIWTERNVEYPTGSLEGLVRKV